MEMQSMPRGFEFTIQQGEIASFAADVVALKHAQAFHGADRAVALALADGGTELSSISPSVGDYRYLPSLGRIKAGHVLFVGVPHLSLFGYQRIREFSTSVLRILATEAPDTVHLAMTIHGPGYGLDEVEAALAQIAGCVEALLKGDLPPRLERICIVEISEGRVERLRAALEQKLDAVSYASRVPTRWAYRLHMPAQHDTFAHKLPHNAVVETAGKGSEAKPRAFVAMPFAKDMDDVFYYGIQGPLHSAGFLCERIDETAFVGDIVDQIKKRIETASVVIAEVSDANPNVYLELGYAWGRRRPTILLVQNADDLRFDVQGQRCLTYERIKDLEESLSRELQQLKEECLI